MRKLVPAMLFVGLSLGGCAGNAYYPEGRSIADIPKGYAPVSVPQPLRCSWDGVVSADAGTDAPLMRAAVHDAVVTALKANGIAIAADPSHAGSEVQSCVYWSPSAVIIEGHVNVYARLQDKNGRTLVTGTHGRGFSLVHLATEGGEEAIVRASAEKAVKALAEELAKVK